MAALAEHGNLADFSLEELATVRLTSVSKRPERLNDAPASVYVIGNEEIRRSGFATLPEVLRLAPNLQVARVDARNYAISARGFNNTLENKLLVMIDGRTVYSPLFSGVYWDAQDVVLEDVERIEVISGPGGTLWGANAVNGVINIITRSAADTLGSLVVAGGSKDEREGTVRYGGHLGNGSAYRVYGKHAQNDDPHSGRGSQRATGWQRRQTGFRIDNGDVEQGVTVQGDAYDGALHQAGTADIGIRGANLLGRINRHLGTDSHLSFQAYWDHTERAQSNAFVEHLNTVDLQVQHALRFASVHALVWGAGYRIAFDQVRNDVAFAFLPGNRTLHSANVFLQDEVALADKLRLTAGLKLESNYYTGLEWLPTVRLSWKANPEQLLWSAVSRAVRTPSRIDRDFHSPSTPPVVNGVPQFAIGGGPDFISEVVDTVELGYRAQPLPNMTFSATVFTGRYSRLRTLEANSGGPGIVFLNGSEGRTTGLETWGAWQARRDLRLSAGLVTQRIRTAALPGRVDLLPGGMLASVDPSHYWSVRASYDISAGQELDVLMRGSSTLDNPAVPAYTTLDLRYGWKMRPDLELSVVAQNLFDRSHREYGSAIGGSEFDRAAYVKLAWTL